MRQSSTVPTPAELRALRLKAEGMTIPEIAQATGLSHHTIGNELTACRQRLHVNKTCRAVVLAYAWGLLDAKEGQE